MHEKHYPLVWYILNNNIQHSDLVYLKLIQVTFLTLKYSLVEQYGELLSVQQVRLFFECTDEQKTNYTNQN